MNPHLQHPHPSTEADRDNRADRVAGGRFAKGNKLGGGNPFAKRVSELRQELYTAVKNGDITAVVQKLIENAKAGDNVAARELLTRLLGPAEAIDIVERLEAMEAKLEQMSEGQR